MIHWQSMLKCQQKSLKPPCKTARDQSTIGPMLVCASDLLHEHPVVALSSHAGVREAQDGPKPVHAQVALAAAALSACGCCVLRGSTAWSVACPPRQRSAILANSSCAATCILEPSAAKPV